MKLLLFKLTMSLSFFAIKGCSENSTLDAREFNSTDKIKVMTIPHPTSSSQADILLVSFPKEAVKARSCEIFDDNRCVPGTELAYDLTKPTYDLSKKGITDRVAFVEKKSFYLNKTHDGQKRNYILTYEDSQEKGFVKRLIYRTQSGDYVGKGTSPFPNNNQNNNQQKPNPNNDGSGNSQPGQPNPNQGFNLPDNNNGGGLGLTIPSSIQNVEFKDANNTDRKAQDLFQKDLYLVDFSSATCGICIQMGNYIKRNPQVLGSCGKVTIVVDSVERFAARVVGTDQEARKNYVGVKNRQDLKKLENAFSIDTSGGTPAWGVYSFKEQKSVHSQSGYSRSDFQNKLRKYCQ